MAEGKRTCFVTMGFGRKTDFETGRTLDLDKSFRLLIKPAVEAAGLQCVRADDILHAGIIERPILEQLLEADVVVADLSTSNSTAIYELGIRHALRPHATIVIAEDQLRYTPFELSNVRLFRYRHLGEDIDADEANRFREVLQAAIQSCLSKETVDSPVYAYLHLTPPHRNATADPPLLDLAPPSPQAQTGTKNEELMVAIDQAISREPSEALKFQLSGIRVHLVRAPSSQASREDVKRFARIVTTLSSSPQSLEDTRRFLTSLSPQRSNDSDTLELWSNVHWRLWQLTLDAGHLDEAIRTLKRTFFLRNDHRSGIDYAFLLNGRAARATRTADAVADYILARRAREEVLSICQRWVANNPPPPAHSSQAVLEQDAQRRKDVLDALEESKVGLERTDGFSSSLRGKDESGNRMEMLRQWLSTSPLKHLRAT
jgi:hypothetical protein